MDSILLIDDNREFLSQLESATRKKLAGTANVIAWNPVRREESPVRRFDSFLEKNEVRLVITDYDLTEGGQLGLFGATVVDWCKRRAIPVGDFSRGKPDLLPREPDLFEIRIPTTSIEASASYVFAIFIGFRDIRASIASDEAVLSRRSPASTLAALLGAQNDANQFVQYGTRYGSANSALLDSFSETVGEVKPTRAQKLHIMGYIMGHLLLNAVLRYPGPILSRAALASYLAVDVAQSSAYESAFEGAQYAGPFKELGPYFWTSKVDGVLAPHIDAIPAQDQIETSGEMNRKALEHLMNKKMPLPQGCPRCKGKNGGFWCPFTNRTVCQRADCAVLSNVWIPLGARLCRIERDFYDEWAPVLGM